MNRNEAITGLVDYALEKELIRSEEKIWAVNSLLDVLEIDTYFGILLQKFCLLQLKQRVLHHFYCFIRLKI